MPEFLYIFGFETPRQRRNNTLCGWDDEDSHGVLIDAPDADAALRWGDQIARMYVAELHGTSDVDITGFIENDPSQYLVDDWPRVGAGRYPDFEQWLERDRQ